MIHPDCGFFTSSPNHYAACGWKVADGYWSRVRREQRAAAKAERAELKRTQALLNEAAPHRRKVKPRDQWLAGICARMYVRGALSRYIDGQPVTVEEMTSRIIAARDRYGYTGNESAEVSLAYADGLIHSPDPKPYPAPHPYGKAR